MPNHQQGNPLPRVKPNYSEIRSQRLDTVAARRSLVREARRAAREEDDDLKSEGLHIASSDDKVASYRGVGLGLYFKVLHWLIWMMMWMMFCSVPYIIVINTSVFTDYDHRNDHTFGIKVFDSFQLSSFTFAAIVDNKKDNGTLQYINTEIADAWKGPMRKGIFLTWISLVDAGATMIFTFSVVLLFLVVDRWLRRVDRRTLEVSDYSLIVGGLPPNITATEVGKYFETHFVQDPQNDKVMDVVLVRGFSTVVEACKEVHRNEQLKSFVANLESKKAGKAEPRVPPETKTPTRDQPEAIATLTTTSRPFTPMSRRGAFSFKVDDAHISCVSGLANACGNLVIHEKMASDDATDAVSSGHLYRTNSTKSTHSHISSLVYSKAPSAAPSVAPSAAPVTATATLLEAAGNSPRGSPTKSQGPISTKGLPINLSAMASSAGSAVVAAAGKPFGQPQDPEAGEVLLPLPPPPESQRSTSRAPSVTATPAKCLSVDMSREMRRAEARIAGQRDHVMQRIEQGKLQADVAFVTFNTEAMRMKICKELPSGWWSAWFMRRCYVMAHGGRRWRPWVRQAAAPDDYRFENMSTRVRTNILIQVLTGVIMFAFIIVCAAFITWLSATVNKQNRMLLWDRSEMTAAIQVGIAKLASFPATTTPLNKTVYDTFCAGAMPSCSRYANSKYPAANIDMEFRAEWTFPNSTARLLNERPIRKDLQQCSQSVSCAASYCLPCYCLGLSYLSLDDASAELLTHIHDACDTYLEPFDLQRDGIKVAISLVIALINGLLTYVLRVLKFYVEKHWTTTDTELSFAVWNYLVKLINSVAVLLIVNCSTLRDLQEKALAHEARWLQKLILNGLYDDFTPEWYNAVGFSVMILMMINVASPLLRSFVEWAIKVVLRVRLLWLHCGQLGAPEEYNTAFRTMQFTLEARVSDVLFNLTLALLFGSGMPLCYLICSVYLLMCFWWDRVNLLSFSQPAQRYQKQLPRFIMHMLPVLLAVHCAFGLWMHTYFKADLDSMSLMVAAGSEFDSTGINSLNHYALGRRITQANGLPLLVWLGALAVWLLFGRWIMWAMFKLLGASYAKLAAFMHPRGRPEDGAQDVTYDEALSTVKVARMLRGARTYRIHHLANYKPFLTVGEAGRLWAAALGPERYTRLTTFRVTVEVEVMEGRHSRIEQREVDMFDVHETPITTIVQAPDPPAPVLGIDLISTAPLTTPDTNTDAVAVGRNAAASAGAPTHRELHPHQPPIGEEREEEEAEQEKEKQHKQESNQEQEDAKPDGAKLSPVPSAELQAAALRQVATLQANTGVVIRRVSLRPATPVLEGLQAPGAPPPPAFELDITPVVAAATAAAVAAATATAAAAGMRIVGSPLRPSSSSVALTPRREAGPLATGRTSCGSAPTVLMSTERSPSVASSGHRSNISFKSAPVGWPGAPMSSLRASSIAPTVSDADEVLRASVNSENTANGEAMVVPELHLPLSAVAAPRAGDQAAGGGKAADSTYASACAAEAERQLQAEAVDVAVQVIKEEEEEGEEGEEGGKGKPRRKEAAKEGEKEDRPGSMEPRRAETFRSRREEGPDRPVMRPIMIGGKERSRSGGSGIPGSMGSSMLYPLRSAREPREGGGSASVRSRSSLFDPSGGSGGGAGCGSSFTGASASSRIPPPPAPPTPWRPT